MRSPALTRAAVVLATVLLVLAACTKPPGTAKPDYDSLPDWTRTYVRLCDAGDTDGLSKHLANSDRNGADARRRIAELGSGKGWQVTSVDVAGTGVSEQECQVTAELRDASGTHRTLSLHATWVDGRWMVPLGG